MVLDGPAYQTFLMPVRHTSEADMHAAFAGNGEARWVAVPELLAVLASAESSGNVRVYEMRCVCVCVCVCVCQHILILLSLNAHIKSVMSRCWFWFWEFMQKADRICMTRRNFYHYICHSSHCSTNRVLSARFKPCPSRSRNKWANAFAWSKTWTRTLLMKLTMARLNRQHPHPHPHQHHHRHQPPLYSGCHLLLRVLHKFRRCFESN